MSHPTTMAVSYRPDIDGLRAIAVLSVLLFHVFPNTFPGGFIGVDIFFVISGYLISSIIFNKTNTGQFKLYEFYIKRILRILPSLLIMLTTCLIFGYYALFSSELILLSKHVIGASTFTSNFVLWQESGYFDTSAQYKPLLHLWSLGIEEQFYLFWPLLLICLSKTKNKTLWVIATLGFISFFLNIARVQHHQTSTFYLPFTRCWELILGAILAFFNTHYNINKKILPVFNSSQPFNELKSILSLIFITLTIFLFNKPYLFPGFIALIPTISALLIISSSNSIINRYFLSHRVIVHIGLISYPLYLWHWPILAYFNIINTSTISLTDGFYIIFISILLANLTYKIEKPIRSPKNASFKSAALLSLLILIGLFGFYIIRNKGLPDRAIELNQKLARKDISDFQSYRDNTPACQIKGKKYKDLSWCLQSKIGSPDIALWGDSHADHLFPGIIKQKNKHIWLLIGDSSCPPLLGVQAYFTGENINRCLASNKIAFEAIINNKSIKTIVLASLGPFYVNGTNFAAEHILNRDAEKFHLSFNKKNLKSNSDVFFMGLEQTISQLEKHKKNIIIFQDIPEISFMPADCIDRPFSYKKKLCSFMKQDVINRQALYRSILSKLKKHHPNIEIFDSTDYLCSSSTCSVKNNENLIYRDSHHLSIYGSNLVAKQFFSWIKGTKIEY